MVSIFQGALANGNRSGCSSMKSEKVGRRCSPFRAKRWRGSGVHQPNGTMPGDKQSYIGNPSLGACCLFRNSDGQLLCMWDCCTGKTHESSVKCEFDIGYFIWETTGWAVRTGKANPKAVLIAHQHEWHWNRGTLLRKAGVWRSHWSLVS